MEQLEEKLKAETPAEQEIKKYLLANASEPLKEKMMATDKNIKDCLAYIGSEVKARAVNNCYVGSDEEVFGLAIHYFEEDEIKKGSVSTATVKHSKESKPEVDIEAIKKQAIADYKAEEKAKKEAEKKAKEEERQKAIEEAKRKEQEESETLGGMFDLL